MSRPLIEIQQVVEFPAFPAAIENHNTKAEFISAFSHLRDKMEFYFVDHDYVEYLQSIDSSIMNPKGAQYVREKFVVGFVLQINNYKYYVSLSSQKEYQLQDIMTLSTEYSNICYPIINMHNHIYGISATLRMSYMFPVPDNELTKLLITRLPETHRILVQRQYNYVKKHVKDIQKFAEKIYNDACNQLNDMHKHCCDFKALEQAHDNWIKNHMALKSVPVKQIRL